MRTLYVALAGVLVLAPVLAAQQTAQPAAPVPAQIVGAKTAFIANGGLDTISRKAFKLSGDIDQPYNQFYSAMKTWGHYHLVEAPGESELVLEISFAAPLTDCGKMPTYEPHLSLAIFDAKTHFLLWKLSEPVNGAFRRVTWEKNVSQGMENLVEDLKRLASSSGTASVTP